MSQLEYAYLTELQGVALNNITFGSETVDRMDVDFKVDLKHSKFDFNVENSSYIDMLDTYFLRKNEADQMDYIYGIDANNIPFTLYGCSVCHLNHPLKEMRIVWNSVIIGKHLPSKSNCSVVKMKCIVEDVKYRLSVGTAEYAIKAETIKVKTNLSALPDGKFNGVAFDLTCKTPILFEEMKGAFFNLLEMHFLWIGHFPEIKDMRFCDGESEFIYAEHSKGIYQSKKSIVNLERRLFLENMENFSDKFDTWAVMRARNIPVFTVFLNVLYSRDMFEEVKTSTLIQCLDGYFRTHRKQSIKEIVLFAINRTSFTKKVFEYEMGVKLSSNKTLFDDFVEKAVNHRNFISHLFETDNYFKYDENTLAMQKFELLLRLSMLHDIGLEVTEKSVHDYIKTLTTQAKVVGVEWQ